MSFLEIVGLIFLLILCVLGFYGFKIFRWCRQVYKDASAHYLVYEILPPVRMEMFEHPQPQWDNIERFKSDTDVLTKLGFVHGGNYETQLGKVHALVSLWSNPKNGTCVALYECTADPGEGHQKIIQYLVDIIVLFADGSTLTVNNNPHASTLPRPSQHRLHSSPDTQDIRALLKIFKAQIPAGLKVKPVNNPLEVFQDFCHAYHGWLWEEPQLRSPEIAALLSQVGIVVDDTLIEELLDHARYEKTEILNEKIYRLLSKSKSMTAEKWESLREKLVIVHEGMTGNQLAGCFYELLDEPSDADSDKLEALSETDVKSLSLDLFESTLATLSQKHRIKKVASLKEPAKCDVYMLNALS